MNYKYTKTYLIALYLSITQVWADTLPPVIIYSGQFDTTSMETGASLVVIEREEIKTSGARSLSELLQGQAGLNVRNADGDGAKAVIDMRGFGSTAGSNTLVLIDGRRLNNSSDLAAPDLSAIDLANVERIEIIQGSAGTFFGNQAVGGVVNIITRHPTESEIKIHSGVGSFDSYELQAQATGLSTTGLAYKLSARKQDGNQEREQSHANRESLSVRLDQSYTNGQVFFEQQLLHDNAQLPGSLFADELAANRQQSRSDYQGDFSATETLVSRIGMRQGIGSNWNLTGDLSYRTNDVDFQLSSRGWPGTTSTQTRRVISLNPRISGPLEVSSLANLKLTLGSDLETTDYELTSSIGTQAETQDSYATYSQLAATINADWTATVGLRQAEVRNNIDNRNIFTNNNINTNTRLQDGITVGSASLTYAPLDNWQLFARWDQNYRFATVDEHTNIQTGQPVGLETQTGDSYELGVTYQREKTRFQILGYQLNLHNEISFDSSSFFNINLPRTERQGALLEFTWAPMRAYRLGGDYTYTDSSITSGAFAGNNLPLVPRHSGRLFLDYTANKNFGVQLIGNWVGERALGGDFANKFAPLQGYEVLSLATRYHNGPWHLSAKINNLFDREYSETGAVGFDATFTPRDAYFPTSGRSFWLTLDYTL